MIRFIKATDTGATMPATVGRDMIVELCTEDPSSSPGEGQVTICS